MAQFRMRRDILKSLISPSYTSVSVVEIDGINQKIHVLIDEETYMNVSYELKF